MLTTAELRDALDAVQYRDGWIMSIGVDQDEGPFLRIIAPVANSYDGDPIDLGISTYISPNDRISTELFYRFLIWRLKRIEIHEAREMFRYRTTGEPVFDPHD